MPVEEIEEGLYPDRLWFWGVCFTVLPFWANAYYEAVLWKKRSEIKKNPNNRKIVEIPEEIRQQLADCRWASQGKSKKTTILFQTGVPCKKQRKKGIRSELIDLRAQDDDEEEYV